MDVIVGCGVQMTVTNTLDNFASMLDDGEEVTPEDREENMKYLVACIGSVLDVSATFNCLVTCHVTSVDLVPCHNDVKRPRVLSW